MPSLYGSIDQIKAALQPTVDSEWSDNEDDLLVQLQAAISEAIEYRLGGRTFGAPVENVTRIAWGGASNRILFQHPARSIASVTVGGTIDGGTVTGGTAYASTLWTYDPYDAMTGEIYGLRLLSGGWWGNDYFGRPTVPVAIVGDFTDTDDDGDIPALVMEAANQLIQDTYLIRRSSPAGQIGPEGQPVTPVDPWKNPLVVQMIEKYGAASNEWVM